MLVFFCFGLSLFQILSRATFPMKKVMAKLRLYQSLRGNKMSAGDSCQDPRPAVRQPNCLRLCPATPALPSPVLTKAQLSTRACSPCTWAFIRLMCPVAPFPTPGSRCNPPLFLLEAPKELSEALKPPEPRGILQETQAQSDGGVSA